ncbi:murein L,D-transpeptidase family protein [uncultured Devosia sp.]|uniref:L,D-transpeptidase family protein n=1 Tax=uncultured Devosia sp. TaxID=211434 RepID=UPI0035C94C4E
MAERKPIEAILIGLALLAVLALGLYPLMAPVTPPPAAPAPIIYDRTQLLADLDAAGFTLGDPAFIRIFKRERRLEVWLQNADGRFALFRPYDICYFSGGLGPKLREGDRQAPEGFYRVALPQLNPKSRHHLAFISAFPTPSTRA